jgi:hypothetical protein
MRGRGGDENASWIAVIFSIPRGERAGRRLLPEFNRHAINFSREGERRLIILGNG